MAQPIHITQEYPLIPQSYELEFYNHMKDVIQKNIPELKKVALWNNQFKRANVENSWGYPCLFIQFNPTDHNPLLRGVQLVEYTITFHLGLEGYMDEDTRMFALKQKLYRVIQYFESSTFNRLERTGERPDFDQSSYQVYEMDFKTTLTDYSADNRPKTPATMLPVLDLEIKKPNEISSGLIPTTPLITISPETLSFADTTNGQQSAQQSFSVSGSDLTGDITITPPTGFKISLTSGSGYSSSAIVLSESGGIVASTNIYVVFAPVSVTSYSSNISCESSGAVTKNVAVDGEGISTLLTGLQASWSLNGNANDNTGGHNGTATNVTWATGKFGRGGVFDGSTAFINTSDIPEINNVTKFAISLWVKFNTVVGTNDLISKWYYPTTSSWVVRTSGSKIEFAIASSVSSTYNHGVSTAAASITTDVWTNVICVFDGTLTGNTNRAKIYINGTNATSTSFGTIPANTTAGTYPVCLATFPQAHNRLNGMLDEVNIWSKIPTPTEITDLQTKFYPL